MMDSSGHELNLRDELPVSARRNLRPILLPVTTWSRPSFQRRFRQWQIAARGNSPTTNERAVKAMEHFLLTLVALEIGKKLEAKYIGMIEPLRAELAARLTDAAKADLANAFLSSDALEREGFAGGDRVRASWQLGSTTPLRRFGGGIPEGRRCGTFECRGFGGWDCSAVGAGWMGWTSFHFCKGWSFGCDELASRKMVIDWHPGNGRILAGASGAAAITP